jgi:hypothetical protein
MRKFNVQIHQLTPNAIVALSKYVWATTSYGGQPLVEVFAKYYCLHWQKRMIGDEVAQCSHFYLAYPPFEVAEEDVDEGALRCAAGLSSGRDLVEEFVAYGV